VDRRPLDPIDQRPAQIRTTLRESFDRVDRLPVTVRVLDRQLIEPAIDIVGQVDLSHAASSHRV